MNEDRVFYAFFAFVVLMIGIIAAVNGYVWWIDRSICIERTGLPCGATRVIQVQP